MQQVTILGIAGSPRINGNTAKLVRKYIIALVVLNVSKLDRVPSKTIFKILLKDMWRLMA